VDSDDRNVGSETARVINPTYRTLDGQIRKKVALLNRKIAEFGAINLDNDIEPEKVEAFARRKSDLHEVIAQLQQEVDELKVQRQRAGPRDGTSPTMSCRRTRASIA
jgi:hypothetical protein